jgi:hypothetical protein
MYLASESFRELFNLSLKFFITKSNLALVDNEKHEPLTLEIMILVIEFMNHMLQFVSIHAKVKEYNAIGALINHIKNNYNPIVVKYTCAALHQISNYPQFYPQLT